MARFPRFQMPFKVTVTGREAPADLRMHDRGPEGPAHYAQQGLELVGTAEPTYGEKAVVQESGFMEYLMGQYGIEYKPEGDLEIEDYAEMLETDAEVSSSMQYKILARLSSGWEIEPASDDPAHIEHAEFIEDQMANMKGTASEFLENTMDALAYGASISEMVYKPITEGRWKGKAGLDALKPRPIGTFRFRTDKHGNLEHLEQRQGMGNTFAELDPAYFVIWVWRGKGSYVGRSELRAAYRWYKAKQTLPQLWFLFLERYAAPSAVGKFEPNTDATTKTEVLQFLTGLKSKGAAILPKDWELELIESARRGVDYEQGLKYCDRQIAKAILLPSLISGEGERGAYSLGQQHADNFTWVLDALGERLAEDVMADQVIRPVIDLNFATDRYPKFKWKAYSKESMTDRVKAVSDMIGCGILDPDEPVARQRVNLPDREIDTSKPKLDKTDPPAARTPDKPGAIAKAKSGAEHAAGAPKVSRLTHVAKHNHKSIAAEHDKQESTAIAELSGIVDGMRLGLLDTIQKRKLAEGRQHSELGRLRMVGVGEFRAVLERLTGHALHRGTADALSEVQRGAKAAGVSAPTAEDLGETMGANFSVAPPDTEHPYYEPIVKAMFDHSIGEGADHAYTSSKRDVIDFWKTKVPIQRQLLIQYGRQSFTISGVFSDDMLGRVQVQLGKGMIRGATLAEMQLAINDIFMPYLTDPGALDPSVANPWRIENIVRTNMAEAYNVGRMNMMKHPEVGKLITAYEYSAIMDDRTTEFCQDWNGTVIRADDPRVMANNPPNHYQCRSVWIPIIRGETYKLTDELPGTQPMQGFRA